jgi:aryl-alcohol dehydrogenase-like predicted oxidoreductase
MPNAGVNRGFMILPKTKLEVYPLCLGGNVFGWSADEAQSFDVLNHFFAAGGNFIDTADVYSEWAPGNKGGESETIIGKWMHLKNNRTSMVIATKVAKLATRRGLSAKNIVAACEDSLKRLKTDYIDLYYAHEDDATTPIDETIKAFDSLIRTGKVRYVASSNFSPQRMKESLRLSSELGVSSYVAVQDLYNILERSDYESGMKAVVQEHGLSILPYYSLARGFLSGKYRSGAVIDSVRAEGVKRYLNDRGWKTLERLDQLSKKYSTTISAISLAWLRAQPSVSVPIASARTVEQLQEIMPVVQISSEDLKLDVD